MSFNGSTMRTEWSCVQNRGKYKYKRRNTVTAQSPDTAHLHQIHYGFCESHHIHGHGHCIGKGKNQTDGPAELWSQTAWYQVISSSWGKTHKQKHVRQLVRIIIIIIITISCFDKRGDKKGRHVLFISTLCPSVMSIKKSCGVIWDPNCGTDFFSVDESRRLNILSYLLWQRHLCRWRTWTDR